MDDLTELLALREILKEKEDRHEKEVREYRAEIYRLRKEVHTLKTNYQSIERRLRESIPDPCTVGGV